VREQVHAVKEGGTPVHHRHHLLHGAWRLSCAPTSYTHVRWRQTQRQRNDRWVNRRSGPTPAVPWQPDLQHRVCVRTSDTHRFTLPTSTVGRV
jgi:hypothetical protein